MTSPLTCCILSPTAPVSYGGGRTTQLAIHPPGATKFDCAWRLSTATVEASGDWTVFPDKERLLVLLSGNGARLTRKGGGGLVATIQNHGSHYRFNGAVPVCCELVDGPFTDLNFIFDPTQVRAAMRVFSDQGVKQISLTKVTWYLLYCAAGSVEGELAPTPVRFSLQAGEGWLLKHDPTQKNGSPPRLFLNPSFGSRVIGVRVLAN